MMLVKAKSRRKIVKKMSMKKSDGITKKLDSMNHSQRSRGSAFNPNAAAFKTTAASFVPGGNDW